MSKPDSYFSRLRRRKRTADLRKTRYAVRSSEFEIARLDEAIARQKAIGRAVHPLASEL